MSADVHGSWRRARILIVEDDPAVRRSLQLLLAGEGYEVRAYPTGNGLAADPQARQADCLVADLMLPGSNGLTLIHELRGAGWNGKSILISGHLTDGWNSRAIALGFDAVFAKPLTNAALLARIAELCGGDERHSAV